jgi:hypothetical protein
MTWTNVLVAAAVTGLFAGATGCEEKKTSESKPNASTTASTTAVNAMPTGAASGGKHDCKGKNDCKGQGGCKDSDKHDCKGKNACKGQGGCKA